MKTVLTAFILLISAIAFSAGPKKLPESYLNIGAGAGMNYGILGIKSVIGYKNSGGLIGLGLTPNGMFGYEFGFQISWKWLYFNAGYGVFDTKQNEKRPGHSFEETMEAFDAMTGVMIGFGPTRRIFIDAGIGHTFFGPQERVHGIKIDHNTFTGVIGIGIRIGNLAKYPEDEPTDADDTR